DLDIACGGGIEEALEAAMALGPTSRALQDQSTETRAAVTTSVRCCVATLSTRQAGCACRGDLACHREQRVAPDAGGFQETGWQRHAHYSIRVHSPVLPKKHLQLFGKNRGWAHRDRAPRTRDVSF